MRGILSNNNDQQCVCTFSSNTEEELTITVNLILSPETVSFVESGAIFSQG